LSASVKGSISVGKPAKPQEGARQGQEGLAVMVTQSVMLLATPAACQELAGADTLTLLVSGRQVRVRLSGIDAPERRQAYGSVAKAHLACICFRSRAIARGTDVDWYGRVVARVRCGEIDVNAAMVGAGLAWVYRRYTAIRACSGLNPRPAARGGAVAGARSGPSIGFPSLNLSLFLERAICFVQIARL
jgi:endonuclease YncB( thermonuclease family)